MDFTFADYLKKINIIDRTNVDAFILRLALEDFYECYVTYCKDNNIQFENLTYEFYRVTGRRELREIRWV